MQAPGEELLGRLWSTLADKGIGNLFKPWQMRREGRAAIEIEAARLVALAAAQKQADAITARSESAALLIESDIEGSGFVVKTDSVLNMDEIDRQLKSQAMADSLRKEIALQRAIGHAEKKLSGDSSKATDVSVDDDWIYRWRDYASSTSAEQLQHLWGKVLAGEVKKPGSFSLRTLEFLRCLDVREATLIEDMAQYVFCGDIHLSILPQKYLDDKAELLDLQNIGLLSGAEGSGLLRSYKPAAGSENCCIVVRDRSFALQFQKPGPGHVLRFEALRLTQVGKEVFQLCEVLISEDSLRALGKAAMREGYVASYLHTDSDDLWARIASGENIGAWKKV